MALVKPCFKHMGRKRSINLLDGTPSDLVNSQRRTLSTNFGILRLAFSCFRLRSTAALVLAWKRSAALRRSSLWHDVQVR